MSKKQFMKLFAILFIAVFASAAILSSPASALISQKVISWFWTSDTNVAAVATGDVNGDGKTEIVTGGYFNDGNRWVTQLAVWNSSTLALVNVMTWYWTYSTQISSIAVANITGGTSLDIITGGSFFDGTHWNSQLCTWNGTTLALENVRVWNWAGDTEISSVTVANISGTNALDIITGGSYYDGTRWVAQLCTWNGATLALENVRVWTGNTYINSVAAGDISGNKAISIVTGGTYFDGTRNNAQLVVWNGSTLAFTNVVTWFWTGDTEINSIAVANVTGGTSLNIVTGGDFNDTARLNAQVAVWNGSTLALQNVATWFTFSNTQINSVFVANYTGGSSLDIITGGVYNDGLRNNGQLEDLVGASLLVSSATTWFQTSDTSANSVAVGNLGLGNRIVVGGSYFDNTRSVAQLTIWG